jgi:1-phosphofructokinase family hexose kinase
MFLCVSPNPAIDKRLEVRSLLLGQVNRAHEVKAFAGGKAAHVAMVLRALGERPQWIGQCGGASGEELVAGLCALGIETTAIRTQQRTRTNLEILESDGRVTEILEPGATLGAGEWAAFEERCKELFAQGAAQLSVIFSGSLPQGTGPDLYARLITAAREFKCRTLLDTSGEALRLGLGAMPHFVKPNREEATRLLEVPVNSLSTGAAAVRRLLELGAQSAALSMGVDGLLFCGGLNAPVLHAAALPVKARSTVGCGDSAFAGFALGMASNLPPEERLRLAAACATANCLADSPGGARIEDIRNFQRQVSVQAVVPAA